MNFLSHPNRALPKHLDKILFTLACSYLLMVLWWLVRQDKLNQPVTQELQKSAEDTQFIAYLRRSLKSLEARSANPQVSTSPSPAQAGIEPALLNQRPKGQQQELPKIAVNLQREETEVSTPIPPPLVPVPIPSPPPLPLATSIPPAPAPAPSLTNVPSLPKASVSSPQPPLSPETMPTPQVTNTLVGLLELGNNSAALFDINGITKKIQVGETIGNSGWWIISIANTEVIVERNGEVRSIYVGQQI